MAKKSTAFPVGLYGALLVALCALTLPSAFAPVERALLGGAALVGRVVAAAVGEAAAPAVPEAAARAQRGAELQRRLLAHDVGRAPRALAADRTPVVCRVVAVGGVGGGGGEPCELRLDRSHAELADCLPFVTRGEAFVGFLPAPGTAGAADDEPHMGARVLLANHPQARPLHAEVELAPTTALRVVVRAASAADPAPVRVDLWDDPYYAARLDRALLPVRTRAVADSTSPVPGGLRLGSTRIWGYPQTDDSAALTLGVFVMPDAMPHAASHVVAWRTGDRTAPATARAPAFRRGVAHELPGAAHGRYLLVADGDVPEGAAVVRDDALLGVAKSLALGSALVTGFGASRQPWNLLLLPDDPSQPPMELRGEVVAAVADGAVVALLRRGLDAAPLVAGELFTGSNGPHCPPGLWIGRAAPDPQDLRRLVVAVPQGRGSASVRWCTAEAIP